MLAKAPLITAVLAKAVNKQVCRWHPSRHDSFAGLYVHVDRPFDALRARCNGV